MRRALAVLLLALPAARGLAAQAFAPATAAPDVRLRPDSTAPQQTIPSGTPRTPPLVKYGKWGATALFVGAMAAGVVEHRAANDDYERLRQYCTSGGTCQIGPDGRYTDPGAEAIYQDVVQGDRAARAFFVAGQVAFAGAAALFVIQLTKEHGTHNIPYSGLVVVPGRTTRIGWRLSIPGP